MYVIGTAGHVDHGKSALIRALTGIDPDRLQEEKERGMTIDLGFAWLKLPGGQEVSIVDVPGHERFIKNMLAGVGSIDLALLVVAADEGVMPQTREHLAILDLLRVKNGILVITKRDLVDDEWLELVKADVEEAVEDTSLGGAPMVVVSSVTGEGLSDLVTAIEQRLKQIMPKKDTGRPRLPIDRVFTISGFGTVVTGTLIDGRFALGQEVEIQPSGLKSRIRGLQTHKQKVEIAMPGSRVAVNLTGVATTDVSRGEVVTPPGWLKPTIAVDAKFRLLPDAPSMAHNAAVTFHSGTTEVVARVRLLEKAELPPGETSWVQLHFDHPVAVAKGDLFILRSSKGTVGGGEIVDPYAKRHRRFHAATLERLDTMEKGVPEEIFLKVLEMHEPSELGEIVRRSGLPQDVSRAAAEKLAAEKRIVVPGNKAIQSNTILFSLPGWSNLADRAREAAAAYHQQFSLRAGIPKEELKSRLKLGPRAFGEALALLVDEGVLVEDGALVRLPDFKVRLTSAQQATVEVFLKSLVRDPYSPPSDSIPEPELLNLLIEQGKVVKVEDNVVFTTEAYNEMVKKIVEHIKANGRITVGEMRDMFSTSRKYALGLMEYLDDQKITRRVGDERFLR
ncbi:MAG: selenocysteine-specific translation elongation factor [Chloroflexi bacterium]|nr:selenocysteine-specific translation elongation factor [Chloroflexota bacterium]